MEKTYKETSRIAIASVFCALGAVMLVILFSAFVLIGIDCGHFIAASILLSAVALVLGVISIAIITIQRKLLKGYIYAILAIILSTPFILAMTGSIYVARVRAEREKLNTGLYNLRLLGKELISYSEANDGYLPDANKWCDLLSNYNSKLTKDNFRHPKADEVGLKGVCHFAFNKNLSGMRLSDVPGDVVLLFEADGNWNLAGGAELLKTRYQGEHSSIAMFFADGKTERYWYYKEGVRKFDSKGTQMYHVEPCWEP